MTYPNAEQLPLIIKLQPFFKEKMGEWQNRDGGYCTRCRELITIPSSCLLDESFVFRLPLAIDPVNPERGLWGMFENNVYGNSSLRGLRRINGGQWVVETYVDGIDDEVNVFEADDPYTCLLKALCAQEGV